jgi:hypothetical protein
MILNGACQTQVRQAASSDTGGSLPTVGGLPLVVYGAVCKRLSAHGQLALAGAIGGSGLPDDCGLLSGRRLPGVHSARFQHGDSPGNYIPAVYLGHILRCAGLG